MSQQPVGATYDNDDRSDEQIAAGVSVKPRLGELVVGVRIDAIPQSEAERLAADGKFHPLTVDENGFLRVTVPDAVRVESEELTVLREIRDLLTRGCDLLQQIASN